MKAQHTPSPWKRWNSGYTGCPDVIYRGEIAPKLGGAFGSSLICAPGSYIAEVSTAHMHLNEREDIVQHENGRLIAAAPLMLEALTWQEMADADPAVGRAKGYYEKARELRQAAIAAAIGAA